MNNAATAHFLPFTSFTSHGLYRFAPKFDLVEEAISCIHSKYQQNIAHMHGEAEEMVFYDCICALVGRWLNWAAIIAYNLERKQLYLKIRSENRKLSTIEWWDRARAHYIHAIRLNKLSRNLTMIDTDGLRSIRTLLQLSEFKWKPTWSTWEDAKWVDFSSARRWIGRCRLANRCPSHRHQLGKTAELLSSY